jgi:hypothetical protein
MSLYTALQASQLLARNETTNSTANSISQFATGLNGVNQERNELFEVVIFWSLGGLALLVLGVRLWERASKHYRHLVAMNLPGESQAYWAMNHSSWWKIKKDLLYAPLGRKRHNREWRLSSAVNMGTLPSRIHTLLLAIFVLSNIIYCVYLNYGEIDKYSIAAELRGRSGSLAVVNMVALVILAGRNNPLISILQISFDTYNLLHRWIGRTVVIESIIHTIAWAYVKYAASGWYGLGEMIRTDPFSTYGTVGTICMILILFTTPSPLRHAFYETFLNIHIILAISAMIGIWLHLKISHLPQLPTMTAIILLFIAERTARVVRLVYYNYSERSWTTATIKALPGDASRVTLHLPKYVEIKPGTHAYLRFATLNAWESHPFSIAWVQHQAVYQPSSPMSSSSKALESQEKQLTKIDKSKSTTDVSFVIHAQTGMTKRLFDAAAGNPSRQITLRAAFEGPYAGHHSLDSYGHTVLFAGSSGITHQMGYIKHLLQGYTNGIVVTRKILLVWIIREMEHMEWVRDWMNEILAMPDRKALLTMKVFVTRPKNPRDIVSPSKTLQMFAGRPNVRQLLKTEVGNQTGAMCVTVCGPGSLADNVREAVREVQDEGTVDFIEESFTW